MAQPEFIQWHTHILCNEPEGLFTLCLFLAPGAATSVSNRSRTLGVDSCRSGSYRTAMRRSAPTLAAYLEHGGAKAAAARVLHVERRTLYSRLARIERLLGTDLGDREVQLRCHLAIRGLDLLKIRSPTTGLPPAEGRREATHRPAGELATNAGPDGTRPPGESARSHACDDRS